ncbi:hypothetical protein DFH11DRAFT_1878619 [Phellopilus nigrolimitatus]|nr:hypothetical protein DFH11DRAFT_1878619 [Phellopilus nigrolimitatus]
MDERRTGYSNVLHPPSFGFSRTSTPSVESDNSSSGSSHSRFLSGFNSSGRSFTAFPHSRSSSTTPFTPSEGWGNQDSVNPSHLGFGSFDNSRELSPSILYASRQLQELQAQYRQLEDRYEHLKEKVVTLDAANEAYKSAYQSLVSAVPALLATSTNLSGLPFPSITTSVTPLCEADYPGVRYWRRSKWTEHTRTQKGLSDAMGLKGVAQRGPTRASQNINVAMLYVENEKGESVDGERAQNMRSFAHTIFHKLLAFKKAPSTWSIAGNDVKDHYANEMESKFPELRFCADQWKAQYIATQIYSSWSSNHLGKDTSIKMEQEEGGNAAKRLNNEPSARSRKKVRKYKLDMVNDTVDNQIVVTEHKTAPGSRARMTPSVDSVHGSNAGVNAHGKSRLPVDENELDMVNDTVDNQIVVTEHETAPGSRARMTPSVGGMHGSNAEVNARGKSQLPVDENELDMVNDTVDNQIVVTEHETAPGSRARMTPSVDSVHGSNAGVDARGKSQLPVDENELDMVNDTVDNQIVVTEHETAPGSRARMTPSVGGMHGSNAGVDARGKSQPPVDENELDMVNDTVDNQTIVTEREVSSDIGTNARASETTPVQVPIQIVNPLLTSFSKPSQLSQPLACHAPTQIPTSTCMDNATTMNLLPNLLCMDNAPASTGESMGTSTGASSVFHLDLPLLVSGSEDGTVKLWNSGTYCLENTLSYVLERTWVVKLGRDEPALSMDPAGKLVYTQAAMDVKMRKGHALNPLVTSAVATFEDAYHHRLMYPTGDEAGTGMGLHPWRVKMLMDAPALHAPRVAPPEGARKR